MRALVVLVAAAAACSPPLPPSVSIARPSAATADPCDTARGLRSRAQAMVGEGKLDRTLRTLARADALCPGEADRSVALRTSVRADLAAGDEPAMTLVTAGLAAEQRGDLVAAQRSFDRALVRFEGQQGERVAVEIRRLHRFRDEATAAWSADGRTVALANRDRMTVATSDLSRELLRFERPAQGISLSADGARLAVGAPSGGLELWDVALGERVRLDKPAPPLPPGPYVDEEGEPVPTPTNTLDIPIASSFTPDGTRLAVGYQSGDVSVWDVATRRMVSTFNAIPLGALRGGRMAFTAHAALVVTATGEWTDRSAVTVWDVQSGTRRAQAPGTFAGVRSDGHLLATRDHGGKVHLLALPSATPLVAIDAHALGDAALQDADGRMATDGEEPQPDGSSVPVVRLWDSRRGTAREVVRNARLLGFVPGRMGVLLLADASGQVREWDLAARRWLQDELPYSGWAAPGPAVGFSPDGATIAWGLDDGTLRTWSTTGSSRRLRLGDEDDRVTDVAFAPRGDLAVATLDAGLQSRFPRSPGHTHADHFFVFAPSSGEILRSAVDAPQTKWPRVEFSPDGEQLVRLPWSGPPIEVQATRSGAVVRRVEASRGGIFGPDGRTLLVEAWPRGGQSEIRLVDLQTGAAVWSKPASTEPLLGAGRDHRRYFTHAEGTIHEWALATGAALRSVAVPSKDAYPDLLPGAQSVLLTERGGAPRLLPLAGGEPMALQDFHAPVLVPEGATDMARPPAFAPDERTLVAAIDGGFSGQGYLTLYDLRDGRAVAALRAVGGEDLALVWALAPAKLAPGACESQREPTCYRAELPDGRRVDHPPGVATSFVPAPEGPLDFTGEAARALLVCRVGAVLLPIDVCEERVRAPGLLGQLMRGDRSGLELATLPE